MIQVTFIHTQLETLGKCHFGVTTQKQSTKICHSTDPKHTVKSHSGYTLAKTEIIYPKNVGASVAMNFTFKDKYSTPNFEENGLDWQCCLADCSKTAPRILIFSIAMGAEYLYCVKFIATEAPTFFGYIILVLTSVLLG